MAEQSKIKLSIPRQDLTTTTLFRPNPPAVREWVKQLPVTRVQDCAEQIAAALAELNRCRLSPETRFGILEALWPSMDSTVSALSKRFLNQPLVMPEGPRYMAELATRLLDRAGMGYTVVTVEAIQHRDSLREMNPARLTCEAIQRALLCQGRRILQCFQLYRPLEIQEWRTLHQLYALAERQGLQSLPVPQPLSGGATIEATYLQSLLLSCSKPNQLRQSDMASLFQSLAEWSARVSLEQPGGSGGLFVVDLNSDQPPLYSALFGGEVTQGCRFLKTADLIEHLTRLRDAEDEARANRAGMSTIQRHLLDHVIGALGNMSLRNFKRTPSDAPLRVCLGLSGTHYHVAGRQDFESLLQGSGFTREDMRRRGSQPFLKPRLPDIWERANPGDGYHRNEWLPGQPEHFLDEGSIELDQKTREQLLEGEEVAMPNGRYPVYEVRLADASPGGYCLEWTEELPADLRTGDIVGLMEGHSREWVIAVIRWLSTLESARTLIGLELLSPRARAFGALIHQGKGGDRSPPMRALLLPEIKLVGQPETLITPRAGFRERQRVTLVRGTDAYTVQLSQLVAASPGFSQFEFRFIRELGDVLGEQQKGLDAPFDSLWSNI